MTTLPACTSNRANAPAMSADNFCALFLATCGTAYQGYTTSAECLATYAALAATPQRRVCQSYHLCNAVTTHATAVHCPHAAGLSVCARRAPRSRCARTGAAASISS